MKNVYTLERHLVEFPPEQKELLDSLPKNLLLKVQEAVEQQTLYRVTCSYENGKIEQVAYPWAPFKTNVPGKQARFEALRDVGMCKTLPFYF